MPRTRCLVKSSGNIAGVRPAQSTAWAVQSSPAHPPHPTWGTNTTSCLCCWELRDHCGLGEKAGGTENSSGFLQTKSKATYTPKSCSPQVPPEHREPRVGLSQQPPAENPAQTQAQSAGEIQHTRSLKYFFKMSLTRLMSIAGLLSMNNCVLSALTSERLHPPSLKAALCMEQDLSSQSTPCALRASPGSPAELCCVVLTCSS